MSRRRSGHVPSHTQAPPSAFQVAVEATSDVHGHCCDGLRALGGYSCKVRVNDGRLLTGSVDIDGSTVALYPNDMRWDYALGYADHAYFLEVHPCSTSEVDMVIGKLTWLKRWLDERAQPLNAMKATNGRAYYWAATNGCHILPGSREAKRLAKSGLQFGRQLVLS